MTVKDKVVTKIRWTTMEKAQVAQEAGRIKLGDPTIGDLALVRKAMHVLPKERQREIPTITGPAYDWFRETLSAAVEEARRTQEEAKAAKEEAKLARAQAKEAQAALELPPPSPTPATPPSQSRLTYDLRAETGFSPPAVLSPSPAPLIAQPDIAAAVVSLLGQFGKLVGAAAGLMEGGVTFTLHMAKMAPRPAAVPAVTPAANAKPAPQPAPTMAPPRVRAPSIAVRKPRVVVLSLDSGHAKHGVLKGAKDYCERVECWDTPRKAPTPGMFAAFDYVVCTKHTPVTFLAELKAILPDKVRVAQGSAMSVAATVKQLPEVEIKSNHEEVKA